jgi:hypothetical protein
MTKAAWQAHRDEVLADAKALLSALSCSSSPYYDVAGAVAEKAHAVAALADHVKTGCNLCAERRRTLKANARARATADAYRSTGMVKTPYGWE